MTSLQILQLIARDSLNSPPCRKCEEVVARKGWFSPWAGDSLLALESSDAAQMISMNGGQMVDINDMITISIVEGHDDSLNEVLRCQPAACEGARLPKP